MWFLASSIASASFSDWTMNRQSFAADSQSSLCACAMVVQLPFGKDRDEFKG
jgi:hypothetical protein